MPLMFAYTRKERITAAVTKRWQLLSLLFGAGLMLDGLTGPGAQALTVTQSAAFSPVLQVDGETQKTGLLVGGLSTSLTDVSVTINLTKCGGLTPISADGTCNSNDFSYNREIQLFLDSPSGTSAGLVYQDDLTGQAKGATVTWSFNDSFTSSLFGGSTLASGDYLPADSFSSFTGENPNGTWLLYFEDTTPGAPLSINSWSISVTDNTAPGPTPGPSPDPITSEVPGPLPLLGVAATLTWSRRLRKRVRAVQRLPH